MNYSDSNLFIFPYIYSDVFRSVISRLATSWLKWEIASDSTGLAEANFGSVTRRHSHFFLIILIKYNFF
jgi:hypothetical protein